jgi:hypothetical protein
MGFVHSFFEKVILLTGLPVTVIKAVVCQWHGSDGGR